MGPIGVSVVVPALNEAANLPLLMEGIERALAGREYEVLVVDDGSRDATVAVCAALAARYPLFLHVRPRAEGGLSGAVMFGLRRARGRFLVVMDADLQHPPQRIPQLLAPLERAEADFVIGSRYVAGGSIASRWGMVRRANSRVATWLARPLAGRTRDPMSGFFALTRTTLARGRQINPLGYKIALELMCKCGARRVAEVPIHFDSRRHGASKLTVRQQLKYLQHVWRLYDFRFPRRALLGKSILVCMAAGAMGGIGQVVGAGAAGMFAISFVTAAAVGRYVLRRPARTPARHDEQPSERQLIERRRAA